MVDEYTHRYVGNHAQEIGGVMYAPGDFLKLSQEQLDELHIADMVNGGQIVDLRSFTTKAATPTTTTPVGGEKK